MAAEINAPMDIAYAALVAPIDARLSPNNRHVMDLIARWPARDIDDVVRHGDITLDKLCRRTTLPKPYVFLAVAQLEELGSLPSGAIR